MPSSSHCRLDPSNRCSHISLTQSGNVFLVAKARNTWLPFSRDLSSVFHAVFSSLRHLPFSFSLVLLLSLRRVCFPGVLPFLRYFSRTFSPMALMEFKYQQLTPYILTPSLSGVWLPVVPSNQILQWAPQTKCVQSIGHHCKVTICLTVQIRSLSNVIMVHY